MKLTRKAFIAAAERHVGPGLVSALTLPAAVELSDVGELLATALMGGVPDLPLLHVDVQYASDVRHLTAGEAWNIGLLRDPFPTCWTDALAAPVIAGARGVEQLDEGIPQFGIMTMGDCGHGVTFAFARHSWPMAQGEMVMVTTYGAPLDPGATLSRRLNS